MTTQPVRDDARPTVIGEAQHTIDPVVVAGMRVDVQRVIDLVTELGHDPNRTVTVHIEPTTVTVVTAHQADGVIVLRTTEHRVIR